jgi:hypothetical protein
MMTVSGVLALIAVAVLAVMLWNDPIAAGHSAQSVLTIGVLFAAGIAWYAIFYSVRRSQGIDVSRAFEEIPID